MKHNRFPLRLLPAALLAAVLLFVMPSALAVTYADIMAGINQMMEDYPQGTAYRGSANCVIFAKDLCTRIFGNAPNTEGGNSGNGWRDLSSLYELRPGDYLRYKTSQRHAVVIMSVDLANEKITVAESNYPSTTLGIKSDCTRYNRELYFSQITEWVAATSEQNEYYYSTDIPALEQVFVTKQTDSGFRINARFATDDGLAMVQFPTWIASDAAQDSIQWYTGEYDSANGVWYTDVEFDMHGANASTVMYTDVYVNSTGIPSRFTYKRDTTKPTVTNAVISNRSAEGYRVTVSADDASGIREVRFPTWNSADQNGTIVNPWGVGTSDGEGNYYYDVKFANHGGIAAGSFSTHVYAYDMYGNEKGIPLSISVELDRPTVSDVAISDISADGYRVSAKVTDNTGVARVRFPTWVDGYASSTKLWIEGVKGEGDTWYADVVYTNHGGKMAGAYITDVYAYDEWGNKDEIATAKRISIVMEITEPTITDVVVSDYSSTGYRVSAKVTDASGVTRVRFPTWLDGYVSSTKVWVEGVKGEGDVWYADIHFENHGGKTDGVFITDVYGYDAMGNSTGIETAPRTSVIVESDGPEISNIRITDITKDGYRVTARVTDKSGISSVKFRTWWTGDSAGTMKETPGVKGEGDDWYLDVRLADHGGRINTDYCTCVLAADCFGSSSESGIVTIPVEIDKTPPAISGLNGFALNGMLTVAAKITDETEITGVTFTISNPGDPIAPSPILTPDEADGVWTATLDLSTVGMQDANHLTCLCSATDKMGNTGSISIDITSILHTPPRVALTVPASVGLIESEAFAGDRSITGVEIARGEETAIGESAFSNCSGLRTVILHPNVYRIDENAFSGCAEDLIIYCVRDSAAELYAKECGIPIRYIAQ